MLNCIPRIFTVCLNLLQSEKKSHKKRQENKKAKTIMGWGVVESDVNKFPPGTVNLAKKPDGGESPQSFGCCLRSLTSILDIDESLADQVGVKKLGNVILQPQPSDNPNDPLNW